MWTTGGVTHVCVCNYNVSFTTTNFIPFPFNDNDDDTPRRFLSDTLSGLKVAKPFVVVVEDV